MELREFKARSNLVGIRLGIKNYSEFVKIMGYAGDTKHFYYKGVPKNAINFLKLLEIVQAEKFDKNMFLQ